MLDLTVLKQHDSCSPGAGPRTRVALFNQSSRSVPVLPGASKQQFETHFPGLGLLSIAHSLRTDVAAGRIADLEIKFFDEEGFPDASEARFAIVEWLATADRRVICASSYTYNIDKLGNFMSGFDPAKHLIVIGGAHVTTSPDIDWAHVVVRGEGGAAMRHIVSKIFTAEFGTGPDATGICYELSGRLVIDRVAADRSLEAAPSPGFAFDLLPTDVPYATNFQRLLGRRPQIYVCTQSCRARCTFCSTYLIHGHQVVRPIERVADDLTYLARDLGHDAIEFHDDDLMQHSQFDQIMALMRDLSVPWFCYTRVDLLTHEVARRMREAGCQRVFIGVESMQQEKLDYFNKGTTEEMNRRAIAACAESGIEAICGFILGAPGDTLKSMIADLECFLRAPIFALNVSILSPDPGTVEFIRARKSMTEISQAYDPARKRLVPDIARWGKGNPRGLPSLCPAVSKQDLNNLRRLALCAFYLRDHVWDRMIAGLNPDQKSIVADWYQYLRIHAWEPLSRDPGNEEIGRLVQGMIEGRYGFRASVGAELCGVTCPLRT